VSFTIAITKDHDGIKTESISGLECIPDGAMLYIAGHIPAPDTSPVLTLSVQLYGPKDATDHRELIASASSTSAQRTFAPPTTEDDVTVERAPDSHRVVNFAEITVTDD
jgi:hypothetical protein